MRKISLLDWKKVLIFCLLAYGITWTWWLWRLSPYLANLLNGQAVERSMLGGLDVSLGMAGPLIAALILRFLNREPIRGTLGLRQRWTVYAAAFLIPLVIFLLSLVISDLSGAASFTWAEKSIPATLIPLLGIGAPLAILSALAEEYGWRGYLLPLLLPLGDIPAAVISGLIWGLWHLPILVTGLTFPGVAVGRAVAAFLLFTILISFWFVWLSHTSQKSPAAAAVFHGSLNTWTDLIGAVHLPGGSPALVGMFGVIPALTAGGLWLIFWCVLRRFFVAQSRE